MELADWIPEPMFDVESDWHPTPVKDLPSWAEARRVAVDCETCDPALTTLGPGVRRGGYVVGVSFAIEDGPAYYLPIRHGSGRNLDPEHVVAYLRDQAAVFRGEIVGANLQYDLDYLAELGIWFGACEFFRDVQVAEPILDELQLRYSLEEIAARHGLPGKTENRLREAAAARGLDAKAELWKMPARHVAEYAIQDVRLPLVLLRRQEREIDNQDLWGIYDLESRLLPVLVRMRRRGVRIDTDHLDEVERFTTQQEAEALAVVKHRTGVEIALGDVWRPEPLAEALGHIGVSVPTTAKSEQPSVTTDILTGIDDPVAAAILRARAMDKVRTSFVTSIRTYMTNGRIHCTFNQLRMHSDKGSERGAAYGRMSSSDPNMQQQPGRDEELGPMWRNIYIPEDGALWAACDYSSQEPRMTVHYAELAKCAGAEAMGNRFREKPATDLHQAMADLAGIKRKEAKTIFLGLCYGMGGGKLCRKLGLPTRKETIRGREYDVAGEEGAVLLGRFDAMVPFVRQLSKKVESRAKRIGFIRTLLGRRCRFPKDKAGRYDWTYKALNRLIQGSSADQTKAAMVAIDAAGYPIQLQVHDEIDLSVESPDVANEVAKIMVDCVPLRVPSQVDVEIGESWGRAK